MEAPASSPRSRILGHSSMFRFFRSLVGSKGSPKSSDKALLGGQSCPFPEQNATPLMTDHQGGAGRESRPPATLPYTLSVALPQPDPSGLGLGDTGPQTPTPVEVLAQGVEVKPVLPTGSQEVLGNLSELEEREEEQRTDGGSRGYRDLRQVRGWAVDGGKEPGMEELGGGLDVRRGKDVGLRWEDPNWGGARSRLLG